MNILRIIIITCFVITLISCTTIHYYNIEKAGYRLSISKGQIAYEIVPLEEYILLSQNQHYDKLVITDPYFKANKEILDFSRNITIDVQYDYYLFNLYYFLINENDHLERITNKPNFKISIDSIYIDFEDSLKNYKLVEYFSKNFFLDQEKFFLVEGIRIVPVKIPKENKKDFEISFILTILNEDGSLLEKRHLNLNVERKKKVNTFLTPWP